MVVFHERHLEGLRRRSLSGKVQDLAGTNRGVPADGRTDLSEGSGPPFQQAMKIDGVLFIIRTVRILISCHKQ